ncbi:MAG: AIR synthase-related protein [Roseovarius sp.]|nr:AIR synthase-related protein [Roseovarius sp.]
MTQLNRVGEALAERAEVHAMTDVTGFGLAGHALEMARGSGVSIRLDAARLPLLARAAEFARDGVVTGASGRNWQSFEGAVTLDAGLSDQWRAIVTDPQTSGGLLIALAPEAAGGNLRLSARRGLRQGRDRRRGRGGRGHGTDCLSGAWLRALPRCPASRRGRDASCP